MELQFPFSLFLFFASLLFFFLIFIRFRSQNRLDTNKKLPPQPWKLPLIGHMHHLVGAPPLQVLANLALNLGPVFYLQLGEVSSIVISSPTMAKEILRTHDISFSSRPKLLTVEIVAYNYAGIAFSPYGPYWRQMHKISIVELLSAKKVRSFRPLRERESWNLVESISMDISKTINLSEKISTLINMIICKVAIGDRCDAQTQAKLLTLIEEIVRSASGFSVSDLFPSIKVLDLITGRRSNLMKIHMSMDVLLDEIISEHKEHRARKQSEDENQDLLDILLKLKDDGGLEVPLTSDNIKAVIQDMIVAGNDTSAATISWAISELIKNPRVMKKLQSELRNTLKGKEKIHESDIEKLEYLKLVIMETLRLHPPLPLLLPRECREECDIGRYHIPAKTKVIINVWRLGRDPDNWIDPGSFKPERFSEISKSMMGGDHFEFLPFGAGRRMCPGMSLGLANVELPLVMLLYHFNWELPNGARFEDLDMSESFGSSLKRKNPLLLVPSHYNHHE